MVSGDFLLGVSDVGSSPITSELAMALNPATKKMSQGTTFYEEMIPNLEIKGE